MPIEYTRLLSAMTITRSLCKDIIINDQKCQMLSFFFFSHVQSCTSLQTIVVGDIRDGDHMYMRLKGVMQNAFRRISVHFN